MKSIRKTNTSGRDPEKMAQEGQISETEEKWWYRMGILEVSLRELNDSVRNLTEGIYNNNNILRRRNMDLVAGASLALSIVALSLALLRLL